MTATGAVTRDLSAESELERWYRRLLRAYPVGYRHVYGDEILATLMDSADPGRRRPTRADVADLVGGAVRQWFRLPVGPAAVVAGVLSALIVGAVGAAAGSWLTWQTATELPSDTDALKVGATVAGVPLTGPKVDRYDGPTEIRPSVHLLHEEDRITGWTLAAAQDRLRANGWTLGRVEESELAAYRDNERLPGIYQVFEATRHGQVSMGYAATITAPDLAGTHLRMQISPAEPALAPAATAVGWLGGALTGWLLTGWVGYRLRRRSLPRRLAALALGLTALGLAAHPTIGLYETLARTAFADIDIYGIAPAYYWLVAKPAGWLTLGTLTSGFAILGLAATAPRRAAAQPIATA